MYVLIFICFIWLDTDWTFVLWDLEFLCLIFLFHLVHSFYSSILPFIYSFIHSLIHSLILSLIHSPIHFVFYISLSPYSYFIHSFILHYRSCWKLCISTKVFRTFKTHRWQPLVKTAMVKMAFVACKSVQMDKSWLQVTGLVI